MMGKKHTKPMKPKLRLRDQNKADKLQQIRLAAAGLFTELGYEAATMRSIASRAGVGLGTLFLYAKYKRDLVFLIYNEELDNIVERAFKSARPEMPFLEQLVSVFSVFYSQFSKNAPLSRILLKELTFLSEGVHAKHFQERRRSTMMKIESLVASAQLSGSIKSDETPAFIARQIFFIYSGAIRWWFASEKLQLSAGITELRRHFKLYLTGLNPTPAALGIQKHLTKLSAI
jgi:AcrR family transcriptional regulator